MSFTQFAAHLLVAALGLIAALGPLAVGLFMRVRRVTAGAVRCFFAVTAAAEICLALGVSDGVHAALALLQFATLIVALGGLALDARRAIVRFSNALGAITAEYDGLAVVSGEEGDALIERGIAEEIHVGSVVVATINHALYGTDRSKWPQS